MRAPIFVFRMMLPVHRKIPGRTAPCATERRHKSAEKVTAVAQSLLNRAKESGGFALSRYVED
jgi:hypothetical protein